MSHDLHTTAGKIDDLRARIDEAVHAGSARAVEKQHSKGKKTARERIEMLVDADSFTEIDEFARHRAHGFGMEDNRPYGDGVVIETATVDGRPIALYSQDFTVFGGSLGEVHAEKIVKIADFALKSGIPLIGINDSGGARIQEGVIALGKYGEIFKRHTMASGVIPQISIIMGPAAGGPSPSSRTTTTGKRTRPPWMSLPSSPTSTRTRPWQRRSSVRSPQNCRTFPIGKSTARSKTRS